MKTIRSISTLLVVALVSALPGAALGQCSFSSGSTGADLDFIPTNSMPSTGYSVSGTTVTVTNKPNGIFNFQSINISTNWTIKFTRNPLNTPVFLLAQSNVTISGTIQLTGGDATSSSNSGGIGGPGGFDGASSGTDYSHGFGPGGSYSSRTAGYLFQGPCEGETPCGTDGRGRPYGVADIQPMIGGSGGGATAAQNQAGAGGGGAILIASSMTSTITGAIYANSGSTSIEGGSAGSGGSIRIISSALTGDGVIQALGHQVGGLGNLKSPGRIRLEACSILRAPVSDPTATIGFPGYVFVSNAPTIQVTSVAGQAIPAPPTNSFTNPDVSGINEGTIQISVLSSNINPATEFRVIITPEYGGNIVSTGTLSGTFAASTGSVSMAHYSNRAWRVNALIDYIPRP